MSNALDQSVYKVRAQRHAADDFFSGATPELLVNKVGFKLVNISESGVGCCDLTSNSDDDRWPEDVRVELTQAGRTLFASDARIARIDRGGKQAFFGIAFAERMPSVHDLRVANAFALTDTAKNDLDVAAVPEDYKSFCADLLAFLQQRLRIIDDHIRPMEARLTDRERGSIARELYERSRGAWAQLMRDGTAVALPYHGDKSVRRAMKRYTETLVTSVLVEAPGYARAFFKPLGYPGDFQVMNYVYDDAPVGESVRSQYLHLLSLTSGHLIAARLDSLIDLLERRARETVDASGSPFKVLSIGSGPAREMAPLARRIADVRALDVTLVDSEPRAIDFSTSALKTLQKDTSVTYEAFNVGFQDILKERYVHKLYDHADVVYSSGLLDYLGPLTARRYVERLYKALKPGGQIIIGNVNSKPTGALWVMEFVLDWGLHFRDESDMRDMARNLGDADIRIEEDGSRSVYFLIIDKPA